MWDGRIVHSAGALQLLLVIDYIFDWARDVYRPAIATELRALTGSSSNSLAADTDVFSLGDRFDPYWPTNTDASLDTPQRRPIDEQIPEILSQYDSQQGVVRSSRFVHARFQCLCITDSNVDEFLQSFATVERSRKEANTLLRVLKDSWRIQFASLYALETMWTGSPRMCDDLTGGSESCLLKLTVAAYLSPTWMQVLELSAIAITESALDTLTKHVDPAGQTPVDALGLPFVAEQHLVGFLSHARHGPPRSTLQAAIIRSSMTSGIALEHEAPGGYTVTSVEELPEGTRHRFDASMAPDRNRKLREIVLLTYKRHKIGRKEPNEPFLRVSALVDEEAPTTTGGVWPELEHSLEDNDKAIWLRCACTTKLAGHTERCLWLIDGLPATGESPMELVTNDWELAVTHQDTETLSGPNWNGGQLKKERDSNTAAFEKFSAHISSVLQKRNGKSSDSAPDPDTLVTGTPTKLVARNKKSYLHQGHWDMILSETTPGECFKAIRGFAEHMVGSRRNVRCVTHLYWKPEHPTSHGVSTTPSDRTTYKEKNSLEQMNGGKWRGKSIVDMKIDPAAEARPQSRVKRSIPDAPIPAPGSIRIGEDITPPVTPYITLQGDWVSPEEYDNMMRSGFFECKYFQEPVSTSTPEIGVAKKSEKDMPTPPSFGESSAAGEKRKRRLSSPPALAPLAKKQNTDPFLVDEDLLDDEEFEAALKAGAFGGEMAMVE